MQPKELEAVKVYLESHPNLSLVQAAAILGIASTNITSNEILDYAGYPKVEPANKLPDVSTLGS